VRKEPNCCITSPGEPGRGEDEEDNAPSSNRRPINDYNLWCEDLALQPINRYGAVNESPPDSRRVQRPDQGRSGPHCSPLVSRRFSSILVVSRAFRLEIASNAGFSPPQSCKEAPIQEEWPPQRPPRHECGARRATFKTFQVTIGPNQPW